MRRTRASQGNAQIWLPLQTTEVELLAPIRHRELVDALIDLLIDVVQQAGKANHRENGDDE